MHIERITEWPEDALIELIDIANTTPSAQGAVEFMLSLLPTKVNIDALLSMITHAMKDVPKASAYIMSNGDLILTWPGMKKKMLGRLQSTLEQFIVSQKDVMPGNSLLHYYDLISQAEELRARLMGRKEEKTSKVLHLTPKAPEPSPPASNQPTRPSNEALIQQYADIFTRVAENRKNRTKPEILIVEDQAFSRTLLLEMLTHRYTTLVAADGLEALDIYARHAPDITFLDIELPGLNGHELARIIHTMDKNAFIVMVTANHYAEDVKAARENGAEGFIVKPYSKQKLFECVERYLEKRSRVA